MNIVHKFLYLRIGNSFLIALLILSGILWDSFDLAGQNLPGFSGTNNSSLQANRLVELFVEFEPSKAKKEERIKLKVWGRIKSGYHIYSVQNQGEFAPDPTQILILNGKLRALSNLAESSPIEVYDESFDQKLLVHKNDFWFEQEYELIDFLEEDNQTIKGLMIYQICDNRICSLPLKMEFQSFLQFDKN